MANVPEWRRTHLGKRDMLLQDEDGSTRVEGEYKRFNTLAHYQVPDGAQLALVPRQRNGTAPSDTSANASLYNLTFASGKSDSHHRFSKYIVSVWRQKCLPVYLKQ